VKEETNIGGEWLQLLPVPGNVPFDIDAHFIPANPKKQEEGHYHYDIRYLFRFTGNEQEIIHSRDEATGIGWFKMTELEHSPIFGDMVKKIALML
jgi:hypothetical protein